MSLFSVRVNWAAGREFLAILWRHRELTWELTKRELTDKHAGQVLGRFWPFVQPILVIGIYLFLFAVVFPARMGSQEPRDYSVYLLAGLIPWLVFADTLGKSTTALSGNANLVKQVIFPLEILPVRGVIASCFNLGIYSALFLVYLVIRYRCLPWMCLLLPVLFAVQVLAMSGTACVFACVGGYFRDLRELVQLFVSVGLYLMPIVYVPAMVPRVLEPLLYLNPFSYMSWCYQDAYYFGRVEHPLAWCVFPVLGVVTFVWGYRVLRKARSMLGNVL
jgi:lipopolysaccharide transport system permease protein